MYGTQGVCKNETTSDSVSIKYEFIINAFIIREKKAKVHDDRIRMMMGNKFSGTILLASTTVVGKLMCMLIESFTTGRF